MRTVCRVDTSSHQSSSDQQPASDLGIIRLSASELAHFIAQRQISPVEVMEAYLARIQRLNPAIGAFVSVDVERAMANARKAEVAVMSCYPSRPLLGVPVSIKSCIDVEGLLCEAGSHLRKGCIASEDATLVARLKDAGAIVIGNTNTPEMLMAYHTKNSIYGQTNNPWDLSHTAGGSSGGEAAAIAACMSAAGIGSDGGGSIRVPAHFCGICGLKPTPGRIPATGHYPTCAGPFSLIGVVGPMARTVADLRLLFSVIAGYDLGDPVSVPVAISAGMQDATRQLTIGYYEDDECSFPTKETRLAIRSAAFALQDAGFRIEPFRPHGLDRARELWEVIFVQAGAALLKSLSKDRIAELSSDLQEFLDMADSYPPLTAECLLNTLAKRDQLRAGVLSQMERFPVLLCPVSTIPAFRHEDAGWGERHPANYLRTMTYCQHYNLLGNPSAVVPVAASPAGLPIGVQVVGRPYKEEEVLDVAEVLDDKFGWKPPRCSAF